MSTYVLALGSAVLALVGFILAVLVVRRVVEPRRLRRTSEARARVAPAIFELVATDGRTPLSRPASAHDRAAVRDVARDILLEIDDPERRRLVDGLETLGIVDDVVRDLRSSSRRVRRTAANDLSLLPVASTAGPLSNGLHDRDASVRVHCARAVVEAGHEGLIGEAIRVVEDEPEATARQIGGMMMSLVGTGRADTLVDWFGRADSPRVRQAAAAVLGAAGCREAAPLFLEGLTSDDPGLRERCARGLGGVGDRASVTALAALIHSDGEEAPRAAAVASLERLGGPEAVAALGEALSVDSWTVRERAAESLARMGSAGRAALERWLPIAAEAAAAQIRYSLAT